MKTELTDAIHPLPEGRGLLAKQDKIEDIKPMGKFKKIIILSLLAFAQTVMGATITDTNTYNYSGTLLSSNLNASTVSVTGKITVPNPVGTNDPVTLQYMAGYLSTNDTRGATLDGLAHGSNWWVSAGKFGINTNIPATTLDVAGDATVRGILSQTEANVTNYFAGRIGIGTNAPADILHLNDVATGDTGLRITGTNRTRILMAPKGVNGWQIENQNTLGNQGAGSLGFTISPGGSRMVLSPDGYLGIGTTNPATTLDVAGNATVRGNLGVGTTNLAVRPLTVMADNTTVPGVGDTSGQLMIQGLADINKRLVLGYNTSGDYGWIQAGVLGDNYKPLMLQLGVSAFVGIGTTNPATKLDVAGDATVRGTLAMATNTITQVSNITFVLPLPSSSGASGTIWTNSTGALQVSP